LTLGGPETLISTAKSVGEKMRNSLQKSFCTNVKRTGEGRPRKESNKRTGNEKNTLTNSKKKTERKEVQANGN